jgi:hypothetical protein
LPIEFAFSLSSMIESFAENARHDCVSLARFLNPLGCAPAWRF